MPLAATKLKSGKISKSQILTPPQPKGHGMSVKCEKPLDEFTVQVWFLYDHQNLKYCISYVHVSGTELRPDGQTNRWSYYYMPPADISGWGHKNCVLIAIIALINYLYNFTFLLWLWLSILDPTMRIFNPNTGERVGRFQEQKRPGYR